MIGSLFPPRQQKQFLTIARSLKTSASPRGRRVEQIITNNSEHGFFRLPPGIRVMIYNFCLVPGLISPRSLNHGLELPGLPLLRTCKAIFKEARCEIYKNTFIVSDWQEADLLYEACLHYDDRRLMLKSLELRFESDELDIDHVAKVMSEVEEEFPPEAFRQYGPQASRTMESV